MYKINKGLIYAKAENIYIYIPYYIWITVIKMNTHIKWNTILSSVSAMSLGAITGYFSHQLTYRILVSEFPLIMGKYINGGNGY